MRIVGLTKELYQGDLCETRVKRIFIEAPDQARLIKIVIRQTLWACAVREAAKQKQTSFF